MALTPHRNDFENSAPVWLLDLEWGGETWRVATQPVEVVTSAGRRLSYLGGMSAPTRLRESLGRLKTDPGSASATVAAVLPCNVAQRIAQGHSLLAARATIYMGTIGPQSDPYAVPTLRQEDHQLWHLLGGIVTQPRWATPGAPVGYLDFQVKYAPWDEQSKTLLPSAAVLGDGDVDAVAAQLGAIGKVIPLVFGAPGASAIGGSPSYYMGVGTAVDGTSDFWSAANILPTTASSSTLTYIFAGSRTSNTVGLNRLRLESGAVVTVQANAYIVGTDTTPAWCVWDGGNASISPYSGDGLRDSAEVAAYCLDIGGFDVDVPRWLAVKGRGTFNVDTYVNDPTITAWDWLDGAGVLDGMACSMRRGVGGVYPVPSSPDIYATNALTSITVGNEWAASSAIELLTEPGDLVNIADLRFGRSAETEELVRYRLFAPEDPLFRANPSHTMKASIARYGASRAQVEVETFEAASAEAVALRVLALGSMPTYTRSYRAPWFWGWLNVGDAIAITDSDASWASTIAIINQKAWTGAGWAFEVLVDEMLIRDARPY